MTISSQFTGSNIVMLEVEEDMFPVKMKLEKEGVDSNFDMLREKLPGKVTAADYFIISIC